MEALYVMLEIAGLAFIIWIIFMGLKTIARSNSDDEEPEELDWVENNDPEQSVVTNEAVQVNRNNSAPRPEKNQQNLPQVQKNEGSKVCRFCGHQYEPGETFCPDCGAVETEIKM